MTDEPLIRVESLHRVYEADDGYTYALKGIDLEIPDRAFVSVVGQSGCGKSTLLNLIAGLDRPSHGRITVDGSVIDGPQPERIGYVFQQPVLLPWKNIIDNVMLPIKMMGLRRADYEDRAHDLLALVGLEEFTRRFPHQLSGGMQQRASIVRALIHEPQVLLMDEPFGALDALTRDHMNFELLRIWESTRTTVVFVTHDLREAAFLSDAVVVMTRRPGEIREVVPSPLSRPRQSDAIYSDGFHEMTRTLNELIG